MVFADAPESPQSVEVREVRRDYVKLSWKPPAFDGGSSITLFVIEMRDKLQATYV